MSKKLISTLAIAILGFATVASAAQPAAAPVAAPMTTGMKDYNVRVNPLGLLFGSANAALDIGVSDSITVGPMASLMSATTTVGTTTTKTTIFGVGAGVNFFLGQNRFTDAWVFSPFAQYISASVDSESAGALAVGADMGYQWFWENGVNLGLGLGVGYYSLDAELFAISGLLPS
ncbi:MAG: DUF3575 domain-containing protein, partial [Oligoflexia bacterium]|nr:DUF3575 domain-containing protein [Oligoflexia bacterium]